MSEVVTGGAMAPEAFYDSLLTELDALRAAAVDEARGFGSGRPFSRGQLIEWLKFQAWYEREAANFIGSWLRNTPEDDAFIGLCRQVADEARHYKLLTSHLRKYGETMDDFEPEPEWVAWVVEFYADGDDTIERVAAHNITGEIGVMQAFDDLFPRIPEQTRQVIEKIIPDEKFHINLGRRVVERYAVTADAQARVRRRVLDAFALEAKGREAFERRMAAAA